jgi:hypothetical protein
VRGQGELAEYVHFVHSREGLKVLGDASLPSAVRQSALECAAATYPPPSRWREQHEEPLALLALVLEDEPHEAASWESLGYMVLNAFRHATANLARGLQPAHPKEDGKIAALEARVRKLEALLEQLLAERVLSDEDEAPVQPHIRWIEANRDVLHAHPDSFIALDPDKGIVAHAIDGDDFAAQLDKLPPEQRDRVVLFHASMYV